MLRPHLTRLLGWLVRTLAPSDFFDCWLDEDDEP